MRSCVLLLVLLLACENDKAKPTLAPAASDKPKIEKKPEPKFGLLAEPGVEASGAPLSSASPPPAANSKAAAPKAMALAEGAVKLLAPGAEPLRPLRYTFKAGSSETFTYELRTSVSMATGLGKQKEQKIPGVRCELTAATKEISPDGAALVEWSLEKVDVLAEAGASAEDIKEEREAWAPLKGKVGKSVVSSRGLTVVADFQSQDPTAQQMLERLRGVLSDVAVPLPEEAVGKGAKWQHRRKPQTRELDLLQEETFDLVDLTATGGKVARQYTETAAPHEVAGRMPGSKLSLDVYKGSGTIESAFNWLKVVPTSRTTLTHEQTLTASTPDGKQETVKQSMKTTAKLTPATTKK
jgi:hypothetical protein